MRLIDADDLIVFFTNLEKAGAEYMVFAEAKRFVNEQHTAYDVDKVVERLELLSEDAEYNDLCTYEEKTAYSTAYSKAAEIVKAGYGRCGMTESGG